MTYPLSDQEMNRQKARDDFLTHQGLRPQYCTFLAGDASPRRYYRWQKGDQSFIVMDTPLSEKPKQFQELSQFLRIHRLSAPLILAADFNQGLLLLEDFGDETYTKALKYLPDTALYQHAVDVLIHLHHHVQDKPSFLPVYTVDLLLKEAFLFTEWYYLKKEGKPLDQPAQEAYMWLLKKAFSKSLEQHPFRLVLRDYHVDNLMHLPHKKGIGACGLLDFQDALWGPQGYDLVSLLEDARLDVREDLKDSLWQRYSQAFPNLDLPSFRQSSAVLSMGRHLKILGIFTRLSLRDGKNAYLTHLPRVWKLLKNSLEETKNTDLQTWFKENIREEI